MAVLTILRIIILGHEGEATVAVVLHPRKDLGQWAVGWMPVRALSDFQRSCGASALMGTVACSS